MTRARTNTDNELVNLRINLEEAKNENVTILQVYHDMKLYLLQNHFIKIHKNQSIEEREKHFEQELEKTRLKLASVERVAAEKEVLVKKLEESCRQDTSKDTIRDNSKDASKDTSADSSKQDTLDSLRNRLKVLEAENAQLKVHFLKF